MREKRIYKAITTNYHLLPETVGPFGVRLAQRDRDFLDSRNVSLFVLTRLNWVEDGARNILSEIVNGSGELSKYFLLKSPDDGSQEEHRSLLFRIRWMLRSLDVNEVTNRFSQWQQWHVTGCHQTLVILGKELGQIVGAACDLFREFLVRFHALWTCESEGLDSPEAVHDELDALMVLIYQAFEKIREALREREAALAEGEARRSEIVELAAAQRDATSEQRRATRVMERAFAERGTAESDDPYSRMAGLERCNAAQRKVLAAVFRFSHECYPVRRGAKGGEGSLAGLARRAWDANRDEFVALAKLKTTPGYRNAQSLAAKLYKLAARHPSADHFAWR